MREDEAASASLRHDEKFFVNRLLSLVDSGLADPGGAIVIGGDQVRGSHAKSPNVSEHCTRKGSKCSRQRDVSQIFAGWQMMVGRNLC